MILTLLPNLKKEQAVPVTLRAAAFLKSIGVKFFLPRETEPFLGGLQAEFLPLEEAACRCDCLVTIGGDGTILRQVELLQKTQKPVLGINVGHLGFLTALEADELEKLAELKAGRYHVEERSLLCGSVPGWPAVYALNEIALCCSGVVRQLDCRILCDGTLVGDFRGDGVMAATSTGSTAYSMAAGGPIVDARLNAMIATPICAHSMNTPALVFSGDRVLQLQAAGIREPAHLVADGRDCGVLKADETVSVTLSSHCIRLVAFSTTQQFKAVELKLKRR